MTRPGVRIREEQSLSGPPTKNLRGDPLHKLLNIMRVRGTNNIDISLIYTFEMKKMYSMNIFQNIYKVKYYMISWK